MKRLRSAFLQRKELSTSILISVPNTNIVLTVSRASDLTYLMIQPHCSKTELVVPLMIHPSAVSTCTFFHRLLLLTLPLVVLTVNQNCQGHEATSVVLPGLRRQYLSFATACFTPPHCVTVRPPTSSKPVNSENRKSRPRSGGDQASNGVDRQ